MGKADTFADKGSRASVKTIHSRIESKKSIALIQARIDKDLYLIFRKRLKKDRVMIRAFFEAAIIAYLEEVA